MNKMITYNGKIEIKNTIHKIELKGLNGKKLYNHCAWDYIHDFMSRYFKQYCWFDCRRKQGRKDFGKHLDDWIIQSENELKRLKFLRKLCRKNNIEVIK